MERETNLQYWAKTASDTMLDAVIKSFYSKTELLIPDIEKREFGFGIRDKIETRHLAFQSNHEFSEFMADKKPRYVSYSAAHYSYPDRRPMEAKELLGIELTFDIDVASKGPLLTEQELAFAKEQVVRLVEEFLCSDFGLPKSSLSINFSGNRGYHVHVRDSEFFLLGSEERRLLCDYITAKSVQLENFFTVQSGVITSGSSILQSGYPGRIARVFLSELENESTRKKFRGKNSAQGLAKLKHALTTGTYVGISIPSPDEKLKFLFSTAGSKLGSAIDERVTYDATKLIRVPDTIHGSSGLLSKTIEFKELDTFNPYDHALLPLKGELKIVPLLDAELQLNGASYSIKKGLEQAVPLKVATVLVCKKIAEPVLKKSGAANA